MVLSVGWLVGLDNGMKDKKNINQKNHHKREKKKTASKQEHEHKQASERTHKMDDGIGELLKNSTSLDPTGCG